MILEEDLLTKDGLMVLQKGNWPTCGCEVLDERSIVGLPATNSNNDPGLGSSVALPYGRTMPAEVDGVAIVAGTVAANGKEFAFVTTASTV